MEVKKVPQQINDIVGDNVQKLAALFPAVVKDGEVDFDALREELGQFKEASTEKYELTWAGKKQTKKYSQEDIVGKTLKFYPKESVNPESTENLYIEGDNLEVLKLLRQNYYGAIKLIYIDPPYNTGNDFVYNDNFKMDEFESELKEGNVNELNMRFTQNIATGNRYHANWLNMMYSRLMIAKDFLCEDGVIFISIDDHEADNLKKICDEIFGEMCYVANISWQRSYSIRNDSKGIPIETEHIIVYSKKADWQPKRLPRTEEMDAKYSNPDNDYSPWKSSDAFASGAASHQGMVYAVQSPFTGEMLYPYVGGHWRQEQTALLEIMQGWTDYHLEELDDIERRSKICGIDKSDVRKGVKAIVLSKSLEESQKDAEKVLKRGAWPKYYFTKDGMGGIARKTHLEGLEGKLPTNFWPFSETGHNDEAKKEIKQLFEGDAPFDTPKPVRLIDRILTVATDKDSIVLDFFSGSATLADAIMQKNIEDGGKRKYILVQIPEEINSPDYSNLCEVGKERIRRVGKIIKGENNNTDVGFRVFKTDTTNIKWNSLITNGQLDYSQIELTPDLMDFMPGSKDEDIVYEIILRQRDVPLSETMERLTEVGERTYLYAASYLVCLECKITEEMVDKLAGLDPVPVKFIFRDSAFGDDIALKDETFRRLKAVIDKNAGNAKVSYTVEFI